MLRQMETREASNRVTYTTTSLDLSFTGTPHKSIRGSFSSRVRFLTGPEFHTTGGGLAQVKS